MERLKLNLSHAHTTASAPIECAVLYAGEQVMLIIEEREGRLPLQSVQTSPLGWVAADGRREHLDMKTPAGQSDLLRLAAEVKGEGLLVAETPRNMSPPNIDHAKHWLMTAAPAPEYERQRS